MKEALQDLRRTLHAQPDLSGSEEATQMRIKEFIAKHTGMTGTDVGKYGTLYSFDFGPGKHLLVRVDIDALPIQEINTFYYRSSKPDISHKCGHDGHATIGAGLVSQLHKHPLQAGKVSVLFQPAEEIGEGAQGILDDPNFDVNAYDHAVALHNIPGRALHEVLYKTGSFTPAVQSLVVRLKGKTSHAAQPLKGFNPSYAIAEIIDYVKSHEQTDETHKDYHLLTPVHVKVGAEDYGISAGYGEIHFTIRSWTQERMERATKDLISFIEGLAKQHHLGVDTSTLAAFASNNNDEAVVSHIQSAAKHLGLAHHEKVEPFPWGEDFGLFTQHIPGAMFGLGSGEDTPALHNPDYDYPDEITSTGIDLFYQIAKTICKDV